MPLFSLEKSLSKNQSLQVHLQTALQSASKQIKRDADVQAIYPPQTAQAYTANTAKVNK